MFRQAAPEPEDEDGLISDQALNHIEISEGGSIMTSVQCDSCFGKPMKKGKCKGPIKKKNKCKGACEWCLTQSGFESNRTGVQEVEEEPLRYDGWVWPHIS